MQIKKELKFGVFKPHVCTGYGFESTMCNRNGFVGHANGILATTSAEDANRFTFSFSIRYILLFSKCYCVVQLLVLRSSQNC